MELLELKNDQILHFRFKKLKSGKIFMANDFGNRVILEESDFKKFVNKEALDDKLMDILHSKNFFYSEEEFNQNLIRDLAGKWIVRNKYFLKGPALQIIVVTLYCNHGCKYCHASAKTNSPAKYHMTQEHAKKAVDVIFETTAGDITIEFQGGEPLANWDVVKYIIEYAREKNKEYNLRLKFALVTNLTLMDEEKLDFLMADDIGICTSLDGQKEVHDYNRVYMTGASSYDEVVKWINIINEEYKKRKIGKRMGAVATATKKSLSFPKEIIDTYIGLGLEGIFMRELNPFGMALKLWDEIGYEQEEYAKFYEEMLDYITQKQKEGVLIKDSNKGIYLYNLNSCERANYTEGRSPCGAALGQLAYNRDGKVYTCDEGRMIGTMGDDSFQVGYLDVEKNSKEIYKEIMTSNVTKSMAYGSWIDAIPGYNDNPISNYIGACPIYSYLQSGNIVSKYKKEARFKQQEATFEKILNDIIQEQKELESKK